MASTSYECLFLFDPVKASTELDGLKTQVHTTLEKYGAQVLVARKWAENFKLAYPVDGHKKGYYYLTFFKMESTKVPEFEHDIRLNEDILRHMVTKIDPKWDSEMLAVAQDESILGGGLRLASEETADAGVLGEGIIPNTGLMGLEDLGLEKE